MGSVAYSGQPLPWYHHQPTSLEREMKERIKTYDLDGPVGRSSSDFMPFSYDDSPESSLKKGVNAAGLTLGGVLAANQLKHVPPSLITNSAGVSTPTSGNLGYRATEWAKKGNHVKTQRFFQSAGTASEGFLSRITQFGNWFEKTSKAAATSVGKTASGQWIKNIASKPAIKNVGSKLLKVGGRALAFVGAAGPVGWAIGGVALATTLAFMIL